MGFKVYDAKQVSLIVANAPIQSGFNEGEFCTVEMLSPAFEDQVGTDGEVTRTATNDRRATVKVKLMQTSDGNAILSALLTLDQNTPGGAGVGTFLLRDRQGTSLYAASKCWVVQAPASTFDKVATVREWEIRCADMVPFVGGN